METSFHVGSVDAVSNAHAMNPLAPASRSEIRAGAECEVALENTRALKSALATTPSSRPDVVKRAVELVGDVNYPEPDTIRMISHLLAIKLHPESEQN